MFIFNWRCWVKYNEDWINGLYWNVTKYTPTIVSDLNLSLLKYLGFIYIAVYIGNCWRGIVGHSGYEWSMVTFMEVVSWRGWRLKGTYPPSSCTRIPFTYQFFQCAIFIHPSTFEQITRTHPSKRWERAHANCDKCTRPLSALCNHKVTLTLLSI